jgi:hypothetical protein
MVSFRPRFFLCYDKDRKKVSLSNGQKTEREWDRSKADRVRRGSDGIGQRQIESDDRSVKETSHR